MSLKNDLIARFPELSSEIVDKYLPIYENNYKAYYNADYGNNKIDNEIILNLLAHLVTVSSKYYTSGENVKQVASESVGGVSVNYAALPFTNQDDLFFNSTFYGQTFKMLIKRNNGAFFV